MLFLNQAPSRNLTSGNCSQNIIPGLDTFSSSHVDEEEINGSNKLLTLLIPFCWRCCYCADPIKIVKLSYVSLLEGAGVTALSVIAGVWVAALPRPKAVQFEGNGLSFLKLHDDVFHLPHLHAVMDGIRHLRRAVAKTILYTVCIEFGRSSLITPTISFLINTTILVVFIKSVSFNTFLNLPGLNFLFDFSDII